MIDESDRYALLALQGPKALEILAPLASPDVSGAQVLRLRRGEVDGVPALISRTGYTGEDGFELYVAPEDAPRALAAAGRRRRARPRRARRPRHPAPGGGAWPSTATRSTRPRRRSRRASAGWSSSTRGSSSAATPWRAQKAAGVPRKLVGFEVQGRGIARQGHAVVSDGRQPWAPSPAAPGAPPSRRLGPGLRAAGAGRAGHAAGARRPRQGRSPAVVVETPFYRRPR